MLQIFCMAEKKERTEEGDQMKSIDYEAAHQEFERYLDAYDREDGKIKLKIVHTYGVVSCAEEIARRKHLEEEDVQLAKLIALLHDIGRFEQIRRFDSFQPETMDHAAYGAGLLLAQKNISGVLLRKTLLMKSYGKRLPGTVRLRWEILQMRGRCCMQD